jgi:hypothetical protein
LSPYVRKGDFAVLVVLLVLSGIGFWLSQARSSGTAEFCEFRLADSVFRVLLPTDTVMALAGPVGTTRVSISGRTARVLDSDCPNHICVRAGSIGHPGQVLVCLPNRVVVRFVGREFDGVTR